MIESYFGPYLGAKRTSKKKDIYYLVRGREDIGEVSGRYRGGIGEVSGKYRGNIGETIGWYRKD